MATKVRITGRDDDDTSRNPTVIVITVDAETVLAINHPRVTRLRNLLYRRYKTVKVEIVS